jgi:histidine phosphotransferase ChpT
MSPPAIAPEDLAARLAARLCHDLMGPVSGLATGLALLDDVAMRADALDLVAASGRGLAALLSFYRVAFGAGTGSPVFDTRELEGLARGAMADGRAQLDWAVEIPSVGKTAARVLLNLTHMAGGALAKGGIARVTATRSGAAVDITVIARGPRPRVHPEVLAGLRGEPLGEGMVGRWAQAFYVHAVAAASDGIRSAISVDVTEGEASFRVSVIDD